MVTSSTIYLSSLVVLIFAAVNFNVIIFLLSVLLSAILGIVLYLNQVLPDIEKDYEVFKENRPIHFIERDAQYWNHMSTDINSRISLVHKFEFNKKFVGENHVDNQLNEVLQLVFQDFIHPWHHSISLSQEFPQKLYLFINYSISAFARRLKEINVTNLLANKLLDEVIKHNRLYRITKNKLAFSSDEEFVSAFFDNERKLEKNFSREKLCLDQGQLVSFIDRLSDLLQYILFPCNSFSNDCLRLFSKGIFVKTILLPIFEQLSSPDFINGIIISLCKENLPTTETFIAVLQETDGGELEAVLKSVEQEILFVRSKDDNGDGTNMKQQLGSLLYLKKIIKSHLKKFEESEDTKSLSDLLNDDEAKQVEISFDSILESGVALEYFTEHMSRMDASSYINFFLNVEAFKISVEQGLFEVYLSSLSDGASNEQCQQLREMVLEAAMNIYETYLSPIAPARLHLIDCNACDKLRDQLSSNDSTAWMSEGLFDDIFSQVREIILQHEPFFPAFKRNKHYLKLLHESDLVKEHEAADSPSKGCDEISDFANFDSPLNGDHTGESFNELNKSNSIDGEDRKDAPEKIDFVNGFTVAIVETGMLSDHGKTFAAYLINVEKPSSEKWIILRRYSEFYLFHQLMLSKCEKFHFNLKTILLLPPKTMLGNRTGRHFIQYRKCILDIYLKKLPFLYVRFDFLRDDIETFLHPGNYNRINRLERNGYGNGRFNPIRTIGNAMKNGSENILDSFHRLSRTLSLQPDSNRQIDKKVVQSNSLNSKYLPLMSREGKSPEESPMMPSNYGKIDGDELSLDSFSESEENIPLLSLLDEVFDLKHQNFWFRRRIIDLFKQIIEATYSDMINRKITDYVDLWTSPTAISQYLELFKNSLWPNGHLVETFARQEDDLLRRKVASKALLLTSLSDLKKVVGSEAMQTGLLAFFDVFQHPILNRRLVLVIFELLLKEIFPNNYFDEIFARLYVSFDDKSTRSASSSTADWPPHLSKFIARI